MPSFDVNNGLRYLYATGKGKKSRRSETVDNVKMIVKYKI